MRYIAYTSKRYTAIMLVALIVFAAVFSLGLKMFPLIPQILFALVFGGAILACVVALASSNPVVVVDEDGLLCHRRLQKIPWEDVVAVEHHPRDRKLPSGAIQFSLSESWRPVEVHVTNIDRYAGGAIAWGLKRRPSTKRDGAVGILIECMGTTAKSQELYDCIARYVELHSQTARTSAVTTG